MKLRTWGMAAVALLLACPATRGDASANALLRQVEAAMRGAQTLTAELTLIERFPSDGRVAIRGPMGHVVQGPIRLKKPNLARIEMQMDGRPMQTIVSDGKTVWTVMPLANRFLKTAAEPRGRNIRVQWALPVSLFFHADIPPGRATVIGKEKVDGVECTVVELESLAQPGEPMRLAIGPDKVVRRFLQRRRGTLLEAVLRDVRVGAPIEESEFVYQPSGKARPLTPSSDEGGLLSFGKEAPGFTLPTAAGGQLSLREARRRKRAVVLLFWSLESQGGIQALARLNRLRRSITEPHLETLAVNLRDGLEAVRAHAAGLAPGLRMLVASGEQAVQVTRAYGIQGLPATFVLTGAGRVAWAGIGFDEDAVRQALEKLGVR